MILEYFTINIDNSARNDSHFNMFRNRGVTVRG